MKRLITAAAMLAAAMSGQAAAPGQPFASYWHPNSLLAWDLAGDPDAPYNRSAIPLAEAFVNPDLNINPHARAGEARVTSLVAFGPTSGNPSQGSQTMDYYALNYWQYIDVLVFWGGSAGEGLILAPNPTVIDAAHRNGVAVLGNVFLPPTAYGGQIQWVRDFVQRGPRGFPVADKLMQVAEYYGFDGWFINQETAGGDAALAADMRDFLVYLKARSSLRVMWYDAMTESGSVSWQNALTSANDRFFQDEATRVSDDMFLNFWWSAGGLANSRARAQGLGRDPYDLYAGVDVEGGGYNAGVNWDALFPEGQPHRTSLGFYRPEWTRNGAANNADFYARDNRFWVGPNGDPTDTTTADAWKGIAHYVPARSPVSQFPFVTSFNTGQGNRYAVDGQVLATGEWNNLSLQDVLPTWRWWVESSGSALVPALDWNDSYQGGTSLLVSGTLNAVNDLRLYQVRLAVTAETTLEIAYKTGSARTAPRMKVVLGFEDNPAALEVLDIGNAGSADWAEVNRSLSAFAGRTLAVIGLRFESSSAISNYGIRVGRLAVLDGPEAAPSPPVDLAVEQVLPIDNDSATARLRWTPSPDPVSAYHLYRRNPDQSRTWLGATPNSAYFVRRLPWVGEETAATLEVEAVGFDAAVSAAALAVVARPVPGLVAHYRFEGDALDAGDRAAHGTLHGGSGFTAGRVGALALACNGSDSYVEIPNPLAGDFSIAFWVKTTATAGTGQWWQGQGLVDGEVGGVAADFGVALVGDTVGFGVGNRDRTITFPVAVNDGQWHHVVATREDGVGTMQLAVDGALRATGIGPTTPRTAPASLRIGCLQTGGGFFTGAIDDVRLYNRILDPAERWRLQWFDDIANAGDAADDADPDADRVPNTLERFAGLDPSLVDDNGRPAPARDGAYFTLLYARSLDATDLAAQAVWSPDLAGAPWSADFVTDALLSTDGRIQHRAARVPLSTADWLYFRIQVPVP